MAVAMGLPEGSFPAPPAPPGQAFGQVCLNGVVQDRPPVGIPYAGTHLLVGPDGRVIASLASAQVNLPALVGRNVTLCGFNQGIIEGVPALAVVEAEATPPPAPPSPQGSPPPQLTGVFGCAFGVLEPAPPPANAQLRTGHGTILLLSPASDPTPWFGQSVLVCGLLTSDNAIYLIDLLPLSGVLGGLLPLSGVLSGPGHSSATG